MLDIMAYGVGEVVFGTLFFIALVVSTFLLGPLKI
jgi:hypothetical protein|tara:strand:- start:221 stop:325 length:105 start_codon:yes stop_codon:yes gene_type:complete